MLRSIAGRLPLAVARDKADKSGMSDIPQFRMGRFSTRRLSHQFSCVGPSQLGEGERTPNPADRSVEQW